MSFDKPNAKSYARSIHWSSDQTAFARNRLRLLSLVLLRSSGVIKETRTESILAVHVLFVVKSTMYTYTHRPGIMLCSFDEKN